MENDQDKSKTPSEIIIPAPVGLKSVKTCHRFFAPIVFPEVNPLNVKEARVTPRMGNFPCLGEQCMLWNAEGDNGKGECWDVSGQRGLAVLGEWAFSKLNDVHLNTGQGD